MTCSSAHIRDILSRHNTALDSDQYTPPALAPELSDKIAGYLEQMEIEAAREEHKNKFIVVQRYIKILAIWPPGVRVALATQPDWWLHDASPAGRRWA